MGIIALVWLSVGLVFVIGELSSASSQHVPTTLSIHRGESLISTARRLHEQGLLDNPDFFRLLAILRGDAGRIKAGDYTITASDSPGICWIILCLAKRCFLA